MSRTYRKNIRRTIWQTFSRFVAILAIVALGVGFLAGLLATTPDMRYSGDKYFDDSHLFDVRVIGTMGLTDADADALRAVEGVEAVMPAYTADMLLQNDADEVYVTRLHSLPPAAGREDAQNYLNRVELVDGRMPRAADECVVEHGSAMTGELVRAGDTLTVSAENKDPQDTLHNTVFQVVGTVKSSYYFSMEREAAGVGNGSIGLIAYLPEEAFSSEAYSHIYLTLTDARAQNALTDAYDDTVTAVTDVIEERVSGTRVEARLEEVRAEAQLEIDDAQLEIDDARAELDDGWAEYEDGKATADSALADAAKKLREGAQEIVDGEETLAEAALQIIGAQAQIDAGKGTLEQVSKDESAKLDTAQATLNEQKTQLEPLVQGMAQADAGMAQAQAAVDDLTAQEAALQAQLTQLQVQETALQVQISQLQAAIAAGDTTPETAAALAQARGALAQVQGALAQVQGGLAAVQDGLVNTARPALTAAQQASAALHAQYDAATGALAQAQTQIDAGRAQLTAALVQGNQQMIDADAALLKARKEYADGQTELETAHADLAQGQADYETERAEALLELEDAKKELEDGEQEWADGVRELEDAKEDLAALEPPEWLVLSRNTNVSFASFRSNAEKVEAIATVFPIFFFLVAALVALTTMTRMVEEERLQIGTLKALGFRSGTIMAKYIFYALLASVLGCAVGLGVGLLLFPTIIWNAYTMMYTLPKLYYLLNANYAILASAAAIGCTLAATLYACYSTLAESPANLMRPRAPKAGKRILLERVGFLWKRLKFTHKVTARNLLRYKRRFFMTVIGISGCTALLVAGFGLHDSISDVVNRQFGSIFTYDASLTLPDSDAAHGKALQAVLEGPQVSAALRVHQEKGTAPHTEDAFDAYLFVPEDPAALPDFVDLRTREGGEPVSFSQTGVVITEKMSERIGRGVGESFALENVDGARGTFRIDGVVENYVDNFVYLSAETYAAQFGAKPDFTGIFVRMAENTQDARDTLAAQLLALDDVTSVSYVADLKDSFANMLQKINIIVVVLIVCAGLLAFVVLYNLTNINITERSKEIATIKVLGFYEREVQSYVFRESILLSLIGTLAGLVLGIALHRFVILNVEVDMVMFGRSIYAMSYVYSAALTLLFSGLVSLVLRRKLRNISMVESMKAPE